MLSSHLQPYKAVESEKISIVTAWGSSPICSYQALGTYGASGLNNLKFDDNRPRGLYYFKDLVSFIQLIC